MVRPWLVVSVIAACGPGERTPTPSGGSAVAGSAVTAGASPGIRTECLAVRDHVVQLIAAHYVRHPDQTWDGLDRSDPLINEGLDPAMTRENFATFLASEPGQAWLARARARAIASPEMAATVELCVQGAEREHLDCWLGARTMEALQACPNPG